MTDENTPAQQAARRRRALRITGVAAGVVFILLGFATWQLWQFASDLLGLRDIAHQAQAHVQARDLTALGTDLSRARDLAARAHADADAPAVAVAAVLPWMGDDIAVARELAGVAADLGVGTTGVDPLLQRLAGGEVKDLLASPETRTVIGQVRSTADAAATRLDRLQLDGLMLPVGDDITRLRDGLHRVGPAVDALSPYLDTLTILTSSGTRHTWFVVMQNLGEARPSGGMLGSWLLARTGPGTLEVLRQGSNDDLHVERAVDYSGYLPAGYEQVFGDSMGDWRSLNLSANFPDNARLFAHAWNDRGEEQVDGVLALGQGTVRYLAAATGPVEVAGRTIPASELGDYLTVGVYRDFPDPDDKDAAVAGIVSHILRTLASGRIDLPGLVAGVLGSPSSDYLQLWSSDATLQGQVKAAGLSGELTDEGGPIASVRLADGGANKLDAFMHLGAEYRLGECTVDDGGVATRSSTFTVTLRNAVPEGLPEYVTGTGDLFDGAKHPLGSTRDFVMVHTPAQATVTSALVNDQPAMVQTAWVGERQMLVFDTKLERGATATITLTWDELPTNDDDEPFPLTPRIVLPPLANHAETRVIESTSCR